MTRNKKLEAGLEELFSETEGKDAKVVQPVDVDIEEASVDVSEDVGEQVFSDAEPENERLDAHNALDASEVEDLTSLRVQDASDVVATSLVAGDEVDAVDDEAAPADAVPDVAEPEAVPSVDAETEEAPGREIQLVVFRLDDEYYGVSIGAVEQIIELPRITVVPHTPHYIAGLTNLRGTVLPVLDLRRRLDLTACEPDRETRVIVAQIQHMRVGMIVDAVTEVRRVPEADIEPPSPLVTSVDSAYIVGVAKVEGQIIVLLDLEEVLPRATRR